MSFHLYHLSILEGIPKKVSFQSQSIFKWVLKMKTSRYIQSKQKNFALNNSLELKSKKKNKGAALYTERLEDNLFIPLSAEVIEDFSQGDGNELKHSYLGDLPKIHAVHSSAGIVVNLFTHWLKNPVPLAIALKLVSPKTRCRLKINFEVKVPICDDFHRSPNLDVLFRVNGQSKFLAFGIESKLSEPFSGRGHKGLNPGYLDDKFWIGLPNLKALAVRLSPQDREFKHLDVPQLLKHILGLSRAFKRRFKLLYLYSEGLALEGGLHQAEIDRFSQVAKSDKVEFRALSYQALIDRLSTRHRDTDPDYVKFITSRYF